MGELEDKSRRNRIVGACVFLLVIAFGFCVARLIYLFCYVGIGNNPESIVSGTPEQKVEMFREIIIYTLKNKYYESAGRPGRYLIDANEIADVESAKGVVNGQYVFIGTWSLNAYTNRFTGNMMTDKGYTVVVEGVVRANKAGANYLQFEWERRFFGSGHNGNGHR